MPDIPALAIFGTSFLVGLSGALSPGPVLAYNIRESVRRGFMAGPLVSAGHALVELVVVVLLAMGVARLAENSLAVALIGVIGGAFLLWMGYGMLQKPEQGVLPAEGESHHRGHSNPLPPILGGMGVTLSNPFWALWWILVGAAFMTESLEHGVLGIAAFYLGHILADFLWNSTVSAGLASGRRFIRPRLYRAIIQACGTFLLFLGLYFAATGIAHLG
ncbi:MAG: LysE family transporter [Chloroflexi bacterium]|nr:LysE family transporter [Chloroflexota bacterium]